MWPTTFGALYITCCSPKALGPKQELPFPYSPGHWPRMSIIKLHETYALHALESLGVLGLRKIEPDPDLRPTLKPSFSSETYWKGFKLIDLGSTLDFNSNLLPLVIWCRFFNASELPFSLPQSRVTIPNLTDSYED